MAERAGGGDAVLRPAEVSLPSTIPRVGASHLHFGAGGAARRAILLPVERGLGVRVLQRPTGDRAAEVLLGSPSAAVLPVELGREGDVEVAVHDRAVEDGAGEARLGGAAVAGVGE